MDDSECIVMSKGYNMEYVCGDSYYEKKIDELLDDEEVRSVVVEKYKVLVDNIDEKEWRSITLKLESDHINDDDDVCVDVSFRVRVMHNVIGDDSDNYCDYIMELLKDESNECVDIGKYYGSNIRMCDDDIREDDRCDDDSCLVLSVRVHYIVNKNTDFEDLLWDASVMHKCVNAGMMYIYTRLVGAEVTIHPPILDMKLLGSKTLEASNTMEYKKNIKCSAIQQCDDAYIWCRLSLTVISYVVSILDIIDEHINKHSSALVTTAILIPTHIKTPNNITILNTITLHIHKDRKQPREGYASYTIDGFDGLLDNIKYDSRKPGAFAENVFGVVVDMLDSIKCEIEKMNS